MGRQPKATTSPPERTKSRAFTSDEYLRIGKGGKQLEGKPPQGAADEGQAEAKGEAKAGGKDASALDQFTDAPFLDAARLLADARLDAIGWNGTSAGWLPARPSTAWISGMIVSCGLSYTILRSNSAQWRMSRAGAGLGLAISRRLVEGLGGAISVRSLAMLIAGENPGPRLLVPPTLITRQQLLDLDVKNVRDLAQKLVATQGDSAERHALFSQLKRELAVHSVAEERHFYIPLMQQDAGVDLSRHAIAEHHQMDEMIEDLEETDPSSPSWLAQAKALAEKVEHHLREEERTFFQMAGKLLTEKQKTALAADYRADYEEAKAAMA